MIYPNERRTAIVCSQCGKPMTPFETTVDMQNLEASTCFDEGTPAMQVKVTPSGNDDGDDIHDPKVNTHIALLCEEGEHLHHLHVVVNEESGGTDLVLEYLPVT